MILFQLWIFESIMHILNYGLTNLEWFFQLWMFCIFLFWINTIIHVLPEISIQKITGRANPKFYRKCQSENLSDFVIQNKKNKCTILYRDNFVFTQPCRGARRNCPETNE